MSNLSYMLFGIMLMTPEGFVGGMAHMLFHGVIKMTLFLAAGAFMHVTGNSYIYEVNGVGKKMPVTFICYTLADRHPAVLRLYLQVEPVDRGRQFRDALGHCRCVLPDRFGFPVRDVYA